MADDNKHPADELGTLRSTMREMKHRENELRQILMGLSAQERQGKFYRVEVEQGSRFKLDTKKLEQETGIDLTRFFVRSVVTVIKTKNQ